ncbi:hypothetical protein [Solirubrobacter pauli]|nr:hypothetical protein [Solirubrobacter pauli]
MTKIQMKLAAVAGVLAVFAGSAIASPEPGSTKSAIVVAGSAATDRDALANAHEVAEATGSDLKVVRSSAEQLGVVHMLAARGYDKVVTVGVDRRTAIAPVAGKYPRVRFVAAEANGLSAAISGAV